jgi:DNA mismatch endonuclease, patch repair protein
MASGIRQKGLQDKEALRTAYRTNGRTVRARATEGLWQKRAQPRRMRVPRPPPPSSAHASSAMRGNRAVSTGPEIALRKALWGLGARGYRVNYRGIPGRPDIVFPTSNVAVFVNGCFWHRCPRHGRSLPKSNREYWRLKFSLNVRRDQAKRRLLQSAGWKVRTIWECQIRDSAVESAQSILHRVRRPSV